MPSTKYDVAVIGSGPGGYIAALRAAELGLKTICIEKDKTLGGTCLNVGCIPSKALLQSSEHVAFFNSQGEEHGITAKDLVVDFKQMMARKDAVVAGLVQGIAGLFKQKGVTHLQGMATLESPHKIKVGTSIIEATHIILATGSTSIELPFLPFDEKTIVSSTGALSLPKIPKKLAVIGAGAIGLELASVYHRLGSKVVVIEMLDRICPAMDSQVSNEMLKILKGEGLEFMLSTRVEKGTKKGENLSLTTSNGTVDADVVLVSIGRRPFTDGLGLENTSIQQEKGGQIAVDSSFRTKEPGIFAIGDLIDGPMLAHKASEEGIAVAEIIAGVKTDLNYISIPNVIYTHPEAASVGLTEEEAKDTGRPYNKGVAYFKGNGRARAAGDTEGFVKILGDKETDRLLGIHILGSHASEMVGEGVIALDKGATIHDIAYASHAHPTLSETIKEAALLATKLL